MCGSTPLSIACLNDNTKLVKLLLKHNADPNIQDYDMWTPLMYASIRGNKEAVCALLLEPATSSTLTNIHGETALTLSSISAGNAEVVKLIMNHNRPTVKELMKALYNATKRNNEEIIRSILVFYKEAYTLYMDELESLFNKYSIDERNTLDTALKNACKKSRTNIVKSFMEILSDRKLGKILLVPVSESLFGFGNPLYAASENGHSEIVKQLLGIHPDLVEDFPASKTAAMCVASYYGHVDVVDILIQVGVEPNIPIVDTCSKFSNTTPLQLACENGHLEVVDKLLLKANADPNIITDGKLHALHSAVSSRHLQIVDRLIAFGADTDIQVSYKAESQSPIHIAARQQLILK